jgi:hypothetical protein
MILFNAKSAAVRVLNHLDSSYPSNDVTPIECESIKQLEKLNVQ